MFRREKSRFWPATLAETAAELPNPGRGWYQVYSFDVRETIHEEELKWCLDTREHLAQVILDIGCCRMDDLTERELSNIRRIFDFFSSHAKQMIVRTVYDREGKGMEREPDEISQILRHIRQLGPLFAKYAPYILTLQGLLVGSWGEMHSSRYLSDENICLLAKTLWEATGGTCFLSVRKPVQKRILQAAPECSALAVGLYDDGLFASESHLGTFAEGRYGEINSRNAQGTLIENRPWSASLELSYLNEACVRVPNGGEAPDGTSKNRYDFTVDEVLNTMRRMHLTYLNRVYSETVIARWKQLCYRGKDTVYQGCSLYDYIGLHLGYRFVIEEVSGWFREERMSFARNRALRFGKARKEREISGGSLTLHLEIRGQNVGFGNLFRAARLSLIARGADGSEVRQPLDTNPGAWDAGQTFCITAECPGVAADGKDGIPWREELFLRLRQEDGETIWFANQNAKNLLPIGTVFGWRPAV
ncbi:MAG: DUF4874 domain-containing protein [Lachnospiraceae bacterium]|nr:DUF4874 domain-containing protein [Lachnospiraceae bacterium]